jgi:hypothetical protein
MISGRDKQSVRSTKMETANQKWPNLRYKTYSKSCLNTVSILPCSNGVLINLCFFPVLCLGKFFYLPLASQIQGRWHILVAEGLHLCTLNNEVPLKKSSSFLNQ